MEIRLSLQNRPNLFGVFGFGSFFRSHVYNDIDILIVVNDDCKLPLEEFYVVKSVLDDIEKKYNVVIDITYLSYTEYSRKPLLESDFLIDIITARK